MFEFRTRLFRIEPGMFKYNLSCLKRPVPSCQYLNRNVSISNMIMLPFRYAWPGACCIHFFFDPVHVAYKFNLTLCVFYIYLFDPLHVTCKYILNMRVFKAMILYNMIVFVFWTRIRYTEHKHVKIARTRPFACSNGWTRSCSNIKPISCSI